MSSCELGSVSIGQTCCSAESTHGRCPSHRLHRIIDTIVQALLFQIIVLGGMRAEFEQDAWLLCKLKQRNELLSDPIDGFDIAHIFDPKRDSIAPWPDTTDSTTRFILSIHPFSDQAQDKPQPASINKSWIALAESNGPFATLSVPWIFPHRLNSVFEEMVARVSFELRWAMELGETSKEAFDASVSADGAKIGFPGGTAEGWFGWRWERGRGRWQAGCRGPSRARVEVEGPSVLKWMCGHFGWWSRERVGQLLTTDHARGC